MRCIVLILCLQVSISAATRKPVIVNTTSGAVEGFTKRLYGNLYADAFLGIPFAKPPLGPLRFAPPEPVDPWSGVLQVKEKSKACLQASSEHEKKTVWFVADMDESEDCLYLNVWRPTNVGCGNLTVMVWIHSGGFFTGSANLPVYDGSALAAEKNVIIVGMNYRLSFMGSLYLDIPGAPGNVVLKDQIFAMQWVHDNIAAFGGNPDNVAIFGQSAGGMAVGFHLTNPSLTHLFQRGILQSGTPNFETISATKEEVLNNSLELARSAGCPFSPQDDRTSILECLNSKNASEMMALYRFFPYYFKFPFVPIRNGVEVPLNPLKIEIPDSQRRNIMLGTTADELATTIDKFFIGKKVNEETTVVESEWINLIKTYFKLPDNRLVKQAMYPYRKFDGSYNPGDVRNESVQFISDFLMTCPSVLYGDLYSTSSSAEVYMYSFTRRLPKPIKPPVESWAGVIHGDEIPYVFGTPLYPENGFPPEDVQLCNNVMSYWTQFAKTGNPNNGIANQWPAMKPNNKKLYMDLNLKTTVKSGQKAAECQFWNDTYPDLLSEQEDFIN